MHPKHKTIIASLAVGAAMGLIFMVIVTIAL